MGLTPSYLTQTPGSFVFVYTLAIRPNVDVTGWLTYFITGLLQGYLLVLCILYKRRQRSLGVDDWGNPLPGIEGDAERNRAARNGGETERERAEARSIPVAIEADPEAAANSANTLMIGGRTYERRKGGSFAGSPAARGAGGAAAEAAAAAASRSRSPTERDRLLG